MESSKPKTRQIVTAEINLGAMVCDQLKIIYFRNEKWIDCHARVTEKFTALKKIMRKFYPEKTTSEILREVGKYSREDIADIFG